MISVCPLSFLRVGLPSIITIAVLKSTRRRFSAVHMIPESVNVGGGVSSFNPILSSDAKHHLRDLFANTRFNRYALVAWHSPEIRSRCFAAKVPLEFLGPDPNAVGRRNAAHTFCHWKPSEAVRSS